MAYQNYIHGNNQRAASLGPSPGPYPYANRVPATAPAVTSSLMQDYLAAMTPKKNAGLFDMLGIIGGNLMAAGAPSLDPGTYGQQMAQMPQQIQQHQRGLMDQKRQAGLFQYQMEQDQLTRDAEAASARRSAHEFDLTHDLAKTVAGQPKSGSKREKALPNNMIQDEQFSQGEWHAVGDPYPRWEPDSADGVKTFQSKRNELVSVGVPYDRATKIAAGAYQISRDPTSGVVQVYDLGTQQLVWDGNRPGQTPGQTPSGEGTPVEPTMREDIDYSQGTGPSGFFGNLGNMFSDLFGAGLVAPQTQAAMDGLTNLQIRQTTLLQDLVPGRPSNFVLQKLAGAEVAPGSLVRGDRRAFERFKSTRSMMQGMVSELDDIINNTHLHSPADVSEARRARRSVQGLLADYDVIIKSFEKSKGTYQEGQTATGPSGQKMVYRNGNWEPM